MNDKAVRLGAGDVEIGLGEQSYTLKPTWEACQSLSRQSGDGIVGLMRRVSTYDLDAMTLVARAGLGLASTGKLYDQVPKLLYETGLTRVVAPLIRYLTIVSNGGVHPDDQQTEGLADDQLDPPPSS